MLDISQSFINNYALIFSGSVKADYSEHLESGENSTEVDHNEGNSTEAQYQTKVAIRQDGRELRLTGGGPADCTMTAGLPFIPAVEGRAISRYREKNSSSQLKNSSLSSCDKFAQSMRST